MSVISVIIPVYNVENCIQRTIQSVLEQTYQDFELILIDDGSKDNSFGKCKEVNDDRIVLASQKNQGVSAARNHGLKLAKGKYITFLDSDDIYEQSYLERLMEYDEDLVICGIRKQFENTSEAIQNSFMYSSKQDIYQNMESIINTQMLNSPVNKKYRRDYIVNNGILFDEQMQIGEDYQFNFQYILQCNNVRCIPDLLYVYLIQSNSLTHRKISGIFEQRKRNVDLTNQFFQTQHIENQLVDQLKLKLIYIYLMNEEHPKKEVIYNDYFSNLKVHGKVNKVLYGVYALKCMWILRLFVKVLIFLKSNTKLKSKGPSV